MIVNYHFSKRELITVQCRNHEWPMASGIRRHLPTKMIQCSLLPFRSK